MAMVGPGKPLIRVRSGLLISVEWIASLDLVARGDRVRSLQRPDAPALRALGEIVHDLDIADARFERPETPGVSALIAGICAGTDDDEERIARGSTALDGFYAHFTRRKED